LCWAHWKAYGKARNAAKVLPSHDIKALAIALFVEIYLDRQTICFHNSPAAAMRRRNNVLYLIEELEAVPGKLFKPMDATADSQLKEK